MNINILLEQGYEPALLGLALSYNQPYAKMAAVARRLYTNQKPGELKFLEFMQVWLDVQAPRYWWSQMDTYRIGISKQSESTMHTLVKRELLAEDFAGISPDALEIVNKSIRVKDWQQAKRDLPESFLQRRIIVTNYGTLNHIIKQRARHRLVEWQYFCKFIKLNALYPEFLPEL